VACYRRDDHQAALQYSSDPSAGWNYALDLMWGQGVCQMMVPAHTHTGPVDSGRSSSRSRLRDVQPVAAPQTKWTERRGSDRRYPA
jgi:hypothetical protein